MTSAAREEKLGEEGGEEREIFANKWFFFEKSPNKGNSEVFHHDCFADTKSKLI